MMIRNLGLGKWVRMLVVAAGSLAVLASAGSNKTPRQPPPPGGAYGAPAPRAMNPNLSYGLWQTSFGPVKIERDPRYAGQDTVQGAWRYVRAGQEVIGLFAGRLNGNVLQFNWQEPADPAPLQGSGYLVFSVDGSRFDGKWWTATQDRSGDWNGWRSPGDDAAQPGGYPAGGAPYGAPYGGQTYGGQTYGGQTYGQPPGTAPGTAPETAPETAPVPPTETAPVPPPDPPYDTGSRDYL